MLIVFLFLTQEIIHNILQYFLIFSFPTSIKEPVEEEDNDAKVDLDSVPKNQGE